MVSGESETSAEVEIALSVLLPESVINKRPSLHPRAALWAVDRFLDEKEIVGQTKDAAATASESEGTNCSTYNFIHLMLIN